MTSLITLRNGQKMKNYIVANYMDDALREQLHSNDFKSEQQFFRAYCKLHKKVHGEVFILDQINPQI